MKNRHSAYLAAALGLALTFSCSNGDEDNAENGTFTDERDGKSYKWVKIGTQTWMAENLNRDASGSVCYGEGALWNVPSQAEIRANCAKYGRLYEWEASMRACPAGWHLPSDAEWDNLANYATQNGGCPSVGKHEAARETYATGNCLVPPGTHLKAKSGWDDYEDYEYGITWSGNGLDTYGFSALPGGTYSDSHDGFHPGGIGEVGSWWSTDEGNGLAHGRIMSNYGDSVFIMEHCDEGCFYECDDSEDYDTCSASCCSTGNPKDYRVSVRCVKD
jgi:uncharacterized protein (TIGR02145 family)